jgi:hypothetical protein
MVDRHKQQIVSLPVGKEPPKLPPNIKWPTGRGDHGISLAPIGSHNTNPFEVQVPKMNAMPSHFNTPGKPAKCGKCKRVFYFQPQHKHLSADDTEIIELGCTCPHCERWLHLGYLNEDLLKRQDELRNNRQKRAFKRDYEKWQVWVREALAEPVET